jgi:hypothetical protein
VPGGHGTGEKPLRLQSKTDLRLGVFAPPVFMAALLVVTFLGTWRDSAWRLWLSRVIVIGFIALYVWLGSLPRLRELRRRGRVPEAKPDSVPGRPDRVIHFPLLAGCLCALLEAWQSQRFLCVWRGKAMESGDITEISLDRGQCLGTCPVFRFTASRQGRYSYEGHRHVELLGLRSGRFPVYLFERLAEVCIDLRVLELDDVYPCDFDDAPYVHVTVRYASGVKTTHNEGGDSGPVRLWAFAALIEVAMRQAFVIEDRDSRQRKKR